MCDNTAALQYGISSRISKADPKLYLIFSKFLLQFTTGDDIIIEHDRYGRLVKRSRRRPPTDTAGWSSGQDAALSRRKQGFDSPTGYLKNLGFIPGFFVVQKERVGVLPVELFFFTARNLFLPVMRSPPGFRVDRAGSRKVAVPL